MMNTLLVTVVMSGLLVSCAVTHHEAELRQALALPSIREKVLAVEGLVRKYPNLPFLESNLGGLYLNAGMIQKAIVTLSNAACKAVHLHADMRYVLYGNLAQAYKAGGDLSRATYFIAKCLAESKDDPRGMRFVSASILYASGAEDKAMATYSQAFAEKIEQAQPYNYGEYGAILFKRQRYPEAEKQLRISLHHGIGSGDLYILLADAIAAQGRMPEAKYFYLVQSRLVADIDPVLADEARRKADACPGESSEAEVFRVWQAGRHDIAMERLKSLITNSTNDADHFLYYIAADCCFTQGDYVKAGVYAKRFLEHCEGYADAFYLLSRILRAIDETQYNIVTARDLLERAILIAPKSAVSKKCRRELGRLVGLTETESDGLLVGYEIDANFQKIIRGADITVLEPLFRMLRLKENVYTIALLRMMKSFVDRKSEVLNYVDIELKSAVGVYKHNLEEIKKSLL